MEYLQLNNGTEIPAAGIGTFMMHPEDAYRAVSAAFANGGALVDTANAYLNECAVGRAVKESGIDREKIYLSTKLWPSHYETANQAVDDTLKRLGTDYIDLLFLHQPVGDYIGGWQAMERAVKAGKVRSLGLSNFPEKQIREIVARAEIRPAVVQMEAHPYYPQAALKEYLKSMGTVLMAWFPLGHGDKALLRENVFAKLAAKYGKTSAQIILRWNTQMGNVVIPGSRNETHIRENLELFDFCLTPEEMEQIARINKNKPYYRASREALEGYLAFKLKFTEERQAG